MREIDTASGSGRSVHTLQQLYGVVHAGVLFLNIGTSQYVCCYCVDVCPCVDTLGASNTGLCVSAEGLDAYYLVLMHAAGGSLQSVRTR
jgi:hypothetical protein